MCSGKTDSFFRLHSQGTVLFAYIYVLVSNYLLPGKPPRRYRVSLLFRSLFITTFNSWPDRFPTLQKLTFFSQSATSCPSFPGEEFYANGSEGSFFLLGPRSMVAIRRTLKGFPDSILIWPRVFVKLVPHTLSGAFMVEAIVAQLEQSSLLGF